MFKRAGMLDNTHTHARGLTPCVHLSLSLLFKVAQVFFSFQARIVDLRCLDVQVCAWQGCGIHLCQDQVPWSRPLRVQVIRTLCRVKSTDALHQQIFERRSHSSQALVSHYGPGDVHAAAMHTLKREWPCHAAPCCLAFTAMCLQHHPAEH